MTTQTFANVSPQRWLDIKTAIKQNTGVDITTDAGSAKDQGVEFSWAYGGNNLAVDIVSTSWYDCMSTDEAMSKFADWINGAQ